MEWVKTYSEFHFEVVGKIYNNSGITRQEVWDALGRAPVREDSAEADLFKLLFRNLSTGGIIRQHRDTDLHGNYIAKTPSRRGPRQVGARPMKSAFDGTYLFAGSDCGADRAAALYSLIETAKLNGLDPEAYLRDGLGRIADHPASKLADLLPWRWKPLEPVAQAA